MGKKQTKIRNQAVREHFEVFVSGLPYECTEDDLKKFFDFAASITIKLPKYQDTGRCLGYGHIQFSNDEQYQQALLKNGQNIGSRYINVCQARGKKQIQPSTTSIPVGCKVLFIKNLPYTITSQQLKTQFSSCGIVADVRMIKNWQTKKFKGFAYIDYKDNGSVKKAMTKYHGKNFMGRDLRCDAVTTTMKKGFKKFDKEGQNKDQDHEENQQENDDDEISDEQ